MKTRLPSLALALTAVVAGSGLSLTTLPATARPAPPGLAPAAPQPQRAHAATPLSKSALARVRARQQRLMAQHRTAPTFRRAGSAKFTVDTTADTSLADSAGTRCLDATGACSLRAAIEAANNLGLPVRIVLGAQTYTLTSGTALTVTDPAGVSVVGNGARKTVVAGDGSGIFALPRAVTGREAPGLFLTALTLTRGASSLGGAVAIQDDSGATLVLDHIAATHNTASAQGGAIYADENAAVYIRRSRFTHNQSRAGGAIYQNWSDVHVASSSFTANSSLRGDYGSGGAIYNAYGVVDVTASSISENTVGDGADYGDGGGIYDSYGLTTLTDTRVDGNRAIGGTTGATGGGVFAWGDVLEIDGGSVSHNQASGVDSSGGAIVAFDQAQLAAHGVAMVGNKTDSDTEGKGGGAIYAQADIYPVQIVIDGGSVIRHSDNSAVYVYGRHGGADVAISHSVLAGNTGSANGWGGQGCGGAVCAYQAAQGGSTLLMQGDRVVQNSSIGQGGSGAVTAYAGDAATMNVLLRHDVFSDNRAGASGYGGAVGTETTGDFSPISLRMRSNTFTRNRAGTPAAAGFGGALAVRSYTAVDDRGSRFARNRAIGHGASGGAVYDVSGNSSAFTRSRLVDNSAGTDAATNAGYGGAFYASEFSGTVFDRVTMSDNQAASSGGAFYGDSHETQVAFARSTISGNTAGTTAQQGAGGGVFAGLGVLTVDDSTLTGNRVTSVPGNLGQGGALWYSGSRMALRYSTVSGNLGEDGAGIYADTYGTVLGSIVSQNLSTQQGSEQDCVASDPAYRMRSAGGSVLGESSCVITLQSSDTVSRQPRLHKLADNGGPTSTMAIGVGSPAVGRATYLVPTTDQRGWRRPRQHADAGAYEHP